MCISYMLYVLLVDSKTGYFKELQSLELPSFENKPVDRGVVRFPWQPLINYLLIDNYIDQVLAILTEMMGDKSLQANCMYLTGYYMIARGHVLEVCVHVYVNICIYNVHVLCVYRDWRYCAVI